jgi:SAM-dependent methyltransferase
MTAQQQVRRIASGVKRRVVSRVPFLGGARRDNSLESLPLRPPLPLPAGVSETLLIDYLLSQSIDDADPAEMEGYCREDFRRFVYTWGLARGLTGRALELGANPYFTTVLLHDFTKLDMSLANYFGPGKPEKITQRLTRQRLNHDGLGETFTEELESRLFNTEEERFPFEDDEFDVVFFCEILEHLLNDPQAVLLEIKRVLRPGGHLILTTPNVNRLENVARMISGTNIYDPYSGYGPYGRHNREYNKHELNLLLTRLGFAVDSLFTADVHENRSEAYASLSTLVPPIRFREADLGQYLFSRSRNVGNAQPLRPSWLYRSYPPGELGD